MLCCKVSVKNKKNIDCNAVDIYGRTPFQFACIYGQYNVVKFLLESKENLYDLT